MPFLPWHLVWAYGLDLVLGDPSWMPHPIRWIGRLIQQVERWFYQEGHSPWSQRLSGMAFWLVVVAAVLVGTGIILKISAHMHSMLGGVVAVWMACTTLATRSLHQESAKVAKALETGDLELARERLSWIVSRDTRELQAPDILRALIETVSENISDGIVAPLFYLALGGPAWAMTYKAVNTMDSMVGYLSDRYRHFGWFAARADDIANWLPARLSGFLVVGASACLGLGWRQAWRIMLRDARKMKSPNAGYPEAAAAGALRIQLGGVNIYFGKAEEKPRLGDAARPMTLETYRTMIRLMYVTSFLAFLSALGTLSLLAE